jgi:predicted nucleotidyltransferase
MTAMPDDSDARVRSKGSVSTETLDAIVQRILGVCQPERVILFGSAATGQMTPDSDIDLLVVDRGARDARSQALDIRRVLAGLPYPFDVIVMSRERFDETRDVIGGIAWPAFHHGRVIYEAA